MACLISGNLCLEVRLFLRRQGPAYSARRPLRSILYGLHGCYLHLATLGTDLFAAGQTRSSLRLGPRWPILDVHAYTVLYNYWPGFFSFLLARFKQLIRI